MSVNVPFGFKTEYESTWIGRYHGVESDIRTANIAFNLATKVNDRFSIGGGFQVEYVDALLSQAVDFGTIAGAPVPGTDDGFAKVNGDDWGFGYSLGGIYEIKDNLRVGLGYRSRIDHKIEGTTEFERSATGQALAKASGAFLTSDAFVNFSTPSQFYLGARWDMNEKWALLGEVDRTNWSIFDVLKIQYSNPNQPAAITDERWTDVYFISMGTEYKYDDKTTLSAGIAFDETPVREAYRTPRIPGADRLWLTFGLDYEYNEKIDISFGYTHIFMDNIKVDLSHNDAGSANRGDLQVNYEGSMDIIGLQANYKF